MERRDGRGGKKIKGWRGMEKRENPSKETKEEKNLSKKTGRKAEEKKQDTEGGGGGGGEGGRRRERQRGSDLISNRVCSGL